MSKVKIVTIESKQYINSAELSSKIPKTNKLSKSSYYLIQYLNLEKEKNCICAKKINNVWTKSEGNSRRFDKVFIDADPIIKNTYLSQFIELPKNDISIDNTKIVSTNNKELNATNKREFNLIILNEDEKFKDSSNNVYEVEIRGVRKYNEIYFKIKDISKCFNIKTLRSNVSDKNSSYDEHIDYIHIDTESYKNVLFFTYKGLLRSLFVSRSKETSKFVDWCMKTLFAAQFGTEKQKNKLISSMKGISYDIIHDLFSRNARSMPCIYLVSLNTVGELRESMNIDKSIDDNSIVYKFGLSKAFENRTYNHKSEFKELGDKIDLNLVLYTYIDPIYCFDAEKTLAKFVSNKKINYKNFTELVVISNSDMDNIKMFFENIGNKYSGHTTEFNNQIKSLNSTINELQMDITNKAKDTENIIKMHNMEKDMMMSTHKLELQNKDMLILKNNEIYEAKMESMKYQLQYKDLLIDNLRKNN